LRGLSRNDERTAGIRPDAAVAASASRSRRTATGLRMAAAGLHPAAVPPVPAADGLPVGTAVPGDRAGLPAARAVRPAARPIPIRPADPVRPARPIRPVRAARPIRPIPATRPVRTVRAGQQTLDRGNRHGGRGVPGVHRPAGAGPRLLDARIFRDHQARRRQGAGRCAGDPYRPDRWLRGEERQGRQMQQRPKPRRQKGRHVQL
jgi:hypothetical protein